MQACNNPSLAQQAWNVVGVMGAIIVGLFLAFVLTAMVVGIYRGTKNSNKNYRDSNDSDNDGL